MTRLRMLRFAAVPALLALGAAVSFFAVRATPQPAGSS